MQMQETMIITGGAGFIGCATAARLTSWEGEIVAIDNMHPQVHVTQDRPENLPDRVELIVADVRDSSLWDDILAKYRPSVVLHFAAETGTGQSLTEANRHASVNVVGTTQMLDAFTRAGILPDHIVLSSSRAVYGEGAWRNASGEVFYPLVRSHEQLERNEWDFVSEGRVAAPLPHRASEIFPNPSSIYGATKLAQEHVLRAWAAAMKVPATIFRFQNVYGPGQSPFNPYTGIINLFHRIAYGGGAIEIYEDGQIGRDFVFIDDVVDAICAAVERPVSGVRLLDVGSGVPTTIADAARHIADLHGAPDPVICGKFRDGDVRWAVANVDDLDAQLGVRAQTDFLTSGAKTVGDWLTAQGLMQ
jgi:dTDP-L-rhamnose 4-epimerase